MKTKNKLLAVLLTLCMVISMVSTAFAAAAEVRTETESTADAQILQFGPVVWTNPQYADLSLPSGIGIRTFSAPYAVSENVFHNYEDIIPFVQAEMSKRNTAISFTAAYTGVAEQFQEKDALNSLLDSVYAHDPQNPTGGDYIRANTYGVRFSFNGTSDEINISLTVTYHDNTEQEAEVDAAVSSLIASLDLDGKTDYQKLSLIYDWVTKNIQYDHAYIENTQPTSTLPHSTYAAIIEKKCVCQGYASLMYRLLLTAGIDCRYVTGKGDGDGAGAGEPENHAWNIVKLGEYYYNLDATWDATMKQEGQGYKYFLIAPDKFNEDHERDSAYTSAEFMAQYPMAPAAYDAGAEEEGVAISEANFPDTNFREYVKNNFDKDGDEQLSEKEIAGVTKIIVYDKGITSLKGIENFTALTQLFCYGNELTDLDVSRNTALTYLDCSGNQLVDLELSKNTALTHLDCASNRLTSLDVSKNMSLTYLKCASNRLTSLDVTRNTALTYLDCSDNELTGLDVSRNTALTELWCSRNGLTSLDVSGNKSLTQLICYENQLTGIDGLEEASGLKRLDCNRNRLTVLDVSRNTALTTLECGNNQLTDLELSKNTDLIDLSCFNNQLTSLDLSRNTALTYLNCSGNQLTGLDLSNNTNLISVSAAQTKQTITLPATQKNGQWQIDMKKVVGADNLDKVTLDGSTYSYDKDTGIVNLGETLPQSFKYKYSIGYNSAVMEVTVMVTEGTVEPIEYEITEGENGVWTQGTDGTLTFKANGDFEKFTEVKVDNVVVSENMYTAASGSTVITLKAEYLATLSVGKHTLTVVYEDGEATAEFEIKAAEVEPPHEHSYGDWKSDAENHWRECSCGDKTETGAHTFGDWTVTKEATAAQAGAKERTCSVCGYKETAEIPATGGDTNPGGTTPDGDNNQGGNTNPGGDTNPGGNTNQGGNQGGNTNQGGDTNPDDSNNQGGNTNPGGDTNPAGDTNPSGDATTGGNTNSGGNTNPGSDTTSGAVTSPQTGNNSNLALWFALLLLSGGAVIGTAVVSRKKKYNR